MWRCEMKASALPPRSRYTFPRSMRLTMPLTSSPSRSWKASTTWALSASRTRCTITCLAVCAAIRPNSTLSIGSSMKPPTSTSGSSLRASEKNSWASSNSISESSSSTSQRRKVSYSPVSRSMETRTPISSSLRLRAADASAASSASKIISFPTPFSLETASTTSRISLLIS